MIYLCSPVKTSAVHNFTCVYGPAENVQKLSDIFNGAEKYYCKLSTTWSHGGNENG